MREILKWATKENADSFLSANNANANFKEGNGTTTLAEVFAHQTDPNIFWMYRAPLENPDMATPSGAALNAILINDGIAAGNFLALQKTDQQFVDDGYWKAPEID